MLKSRVLVFGVLALLVAAAMFGLRQGKEASATVSHQPSSTHAPKAAEGDIRLEVPTRADLGAVRETAVPDSAPEPGREGSPVRPVSPRTGAAARRPAPAGRRIPFVVTDEDGAPIPGAIGYAGVYSRPTDQSGRGAVEDVEADRPTLLVTAADCSLAVVGIPAVVESPLQVVLGRGTRLDILVLTTPGSGRTGMRLVVATEQQAFPGGLSTPPKLMQRFGGSLASSALGRVGGASEITFWLDETERIIIPGLRPQRFSIRVVDRLGYALHEEPGFDVRPGETTYVEIAVALPVREVAGQVIDSEWEPITGARVTMSASDRRSTSLRVDGQGEFSLGGIGATELAFRVQGDGYASVDLPRIPIPLDGQLDPFVLEQERQAHVRVRDPGARLLVAERVEASAAGFIIPRAKIQEDGAYLLRGLPAGQVRVRVEAGGRTYEQLHDTDKPEVVVQVPAHGSVLVDFKRPAGSEADDFRVTLTARDPEGPGKVELTNPGYDHEEYRPVLFPAILPGAYTATLYRERDGDAGWQPVGQSVVINVAANHESHIELAD